MNSEEKNQLILNTRKLAELKKEKSLKLLGISLQYFSLSKIRVSILLVFFCLFFATLKFFLFRYSSALSIFTDMLININSVIIPVFTVAITGYAIFQALTSGKTLIALVRIKHQDKGSKYEVYNLYFFGFAVVYLCLIILNFFLIFVFRYLPEEWRLSFFSVEIDEYIASFLISIYLTIVLNYLIEIKSFVFNLFQIFMSNASYSAIDYLTKNEEESE